jgi:hypothetical protein
MYNDKGLISRIKSLCESVVRLESDVIERPSDDHIELAEQILKMLHETE